jgi:hypothetical protein
MVTITAKSPCVHHSWESARIRSLRGIKIASSVSLLSLSGNASTCQCTNNPGPAIRSTKTVVIFHHLFHSLPPISRT